MRVRLTALSLSLLFLGAGLASAESYRELTRTDLRVSYVIPQNLERQNLASLKTRLLQKKAQKTYYKDIIKPIFRPIMPTGTAPVPTVLGRMTLLSQDVQGGYTTPLTGIPVSCQEVRSRKMEADQLLAQLDQTIDQMDQLLAAVDIATASVDVLNQLTLDIAALATKIQDIWDSLQSTFPVSYSQQTYHLQYAWTYPFNQVCKGMNQRTTVPEFTDLSMPGLIWTASSGQQLGDFLHIVQVPQYELSRVSFVKEVSLVSACLDDQSLEIKGRVQAPATSDCPGASGNELILQAGSTDPMSNPGAFTDNRMESIRCSDLFTDMKKWTTASDRLTSYQVAFQLSSLKLRPNGDQRSAAAHAGFMSGRLIWNTDHLVHRSPKTFSDRRDPNKPDQLFPKTKADDVSVQLNEGGAVSITLHTWGNRNFPLTGMQCVRDPFAHFITGWMQEGNGSSLWTLSLHPIKVRRRIVDHRLSDTIGADALIGKVKP